MRDFVQHDVFQAFDRLLGQIGVETDVLRLRIAAAPASLHTLNEHPIGLHPQSFLPFFDERRHGHPQLAPVPSFHHLPAMFPRSTGPDTQHQTPWRQLDPRRGIPFNHTQKVASSPDIVAFAFDVLARRLALLRSQLALLTLDPADFADREQPDGFIGCALRGRNSYTPDWGINRKMQIPDRLAHQLDADVAQLHVPDHQYSSCALMIRNTRSTSSASPSSSGSSARLMVFSFA